MFAVEPILTWWVSLLRNTSYLSSYVIPLSCGVFECVLPNPFNLSLITNHWSLVSPHFASPDNLLPPEYWQHFDLLRYPPRHRQHRENKTKSNAGGDESTDSVFRDDVGTVEFSKVACDEVGCADSTENWLCLGCGGVFCSRFVKSHMQAHYLAHSRATTCNNLSSCSSSSSVSNSSSGVCLPPSSVPATATASATASLSSSANSFAYSPADSLSGDINSKHCLGLSLSDLSCWCSEVIVVACDILPLYASLTSFTLYIAFLYLSWMVFIRSCSVKVTWRILWCTPHRWALNPFSCTYLHTYNTVRSINIVFCVMLDSHYVLQSIAIIHAIECT